MDLELSAEQVALRDTVRRVVADHAPIGVVARAVAGGATWAPDRAWAELASLGAMGLLLPGAGSGLVEATLVAEELGRACYPGPWAATVAATRALTLAGADDELLAALAAGKTIGALGAAARRPGATPAAADGGGTAPAGASSVADGRQAAAEHRRTDAPWGSVADVVLLARAGRLVAVDTALDDRDDRDDRDGGGADGFDRTMPVAVVPGDTAGRDLGPFDPAAEQAATDALVVLLGADALGAATATMVVAVQYAKDRHQFGQPIGAFQAVAHLCVDMLETVELGRGSVLHAAWAADAGDPGAHLAALRLKASADRLLAVGETAIQVLGGIGYTWEHDAHLWLKRLLTWATVLGPPSAYRIELARALAAAGSS
jgi:alkylation response protein AidB-like acyl-CoA dehydrogenase